jgi:Predicted Zn-dependent peptidases
MTSGKAECGLQYAVKRSGSAVAYCSLSIRCGTRDEGIFHGGLAHFTEHTLFKGTEKKSARVINGCLDRLGGELNAFTTKEEIVIHATVLKEDISKALSLLLELATCPIFPKEEIDVERGVVIDEINSYKDSPADEIYDRFEEALFKGHPLGRSILGTAKDVRRISGKELGQFVSHWFTPGNMALTVVADIPEAKMESSIVRLATKAFDGRPVIEYSREIVPVPMREPFYRVEEKRNHETNLVIGSLAPSLYDKEKRFATILLSNILGGPASNSMLNDLLREKNGWVYGVESSYTQYAESGILAISLGCDRCNMERCEKAVHEVVQRLQDEPLAPARLKAAKKQLLGQLAISSDSGETQCLSMGKSLISFGEVASHRQNLEAIEAITSEQIQQIAREIFDPAKTSTLIYN